MSSIESAPAAIPATRPGTFRCALTPHSPPGRTCSAARSPSPARPARAMTGTSPACDTRFGSSKDAWVFARLCNNPSYKVSSRTGYWYGSRTSLAGLGDLGVAGESCAFVEPAGAGLVAADPRVPLVLVFRWPWRCGRGGEQASDLRDGERDEAGVGGRRLVRAGRRRCLPVGLVAEKSGGDGADREGGAGQDGVPGDRGVEPDLGLVQAELVLPELESFFNQPPLMPVKRKLSQA